MLKSSKVAVFWAFHFTCSKMAGRKKEELKLTTEQTEKLLEFYQEEVEFFFSKLS